MKHAVIKSFRDKLNNGKLYPIGSHYEGENAERVLFLASEGFIELNKEFEKDENTKQDSKKTKTKRTSKTKTKEVEETDGESTE